MTKETTKKTFSISLDAELFAKLENYQAEKKVFKKNEAIVQLLKIALN